MAQRSRSLQYMPQLDALRAAAVTVVVLRHFTSRVTLERVVATDLGVRLFFVLSGFLITNLLLLARDDCRSGTTTMGAAAGRFYVRRVVRIAPIYYATLFAAAACGVPAVLGAFWWHVVYLSNVAFAMGHAGGAASHFWTLAIEEQFYLVWPWIVLTMNTSSLRRIAVGAVVFAPLYRIVATALGYPEFARLLTFGSLDALAAGALLATYWREGQFDYALARMRGWLTTALGVLVVLLVSGLVHNAPFDSLVLTLETALLVPVVGCAARGFGGVIGRALEARPIRYVGRISYGIYVYHMFMPNALHAIGRLVRIDVPTTGASAVLVLSCATLLVAATSWTFLERPLLALKEKVSTSSAVQTATSHSLGRSSDAASVRVEL